MVDHRSFDLPRCVVLSPVGNVRAQQRLEKFAMVWHAQMKQFVGDDQILEARLLIRQIVGQRDGARG